MSAAFWLLLTPVAEIEVEARPIVMLADAVGAFCLNEVGEPIEGLDVARSHMVAEIVGVQPSSAREWLSLNLTNIGLWAYGPAVACPNLDQARGDALRAAQAWQSEPHEESRQERLFRESRIMAEWAEEYPEAAAGEVDDPDADLALAQMMLPPVNPAEPHRWMPLAAGEVECGFCGKLQDAPLHDRHQV
jgi:hypothetical protein